MMKRMESYLSTLKGAAIMLSALLCILLISCSSPQSEICIVSITLEEEETRSITASLLPFPPILFTTGRYTEEQEFPMEKCQKQIASKSLQEMEFS